MGIQTSSNVRFFAYYFVKLHLLHFSKIGHKEVTKQ